MSPVPLDQGTPRAEPLPFRLEMTGLDAIQSQPLGKSPVADARVPLFPILLGIGHRAITPATTPAVAARVRAVLAGLKRDCEGALHVMSALAEGADQLV